MLYYYMLNHSNIIDYIFDAKINPDIMYILWKKDIQNSEKQCIVFSHLSGVALNFS